MSDNAHHSAKALDDRSIRERGWAEDAQSCQNGWGQKRREYEIGVSAKLENCLTPPLCLCLSVCLSVCLRVSPQFPLCVCERVRAWLVGMWVFACLNCWASVFVVGALLGNVVRMLCHVLRTLCNAVNFKMLCDFDCVQFQTAWYVRPFAVCQCCQCVTNIVWGALAQCTARLASTSKLSNVGPG